MFQNFTSGKLFLKYFNLFWIFYFIINVLGFSVPYIYHLIAKQHGFRLWNGCVMLAAGMIVPGGNVNIPNNNEKKMTPEPGCDTININKIEEEKQNFEKEIKLICKTEMVNVDEKTFISKKINETIKCNIIAFVYLPELNGRCFASLRVDEKIQDTYFLKNNGVYEIYLKLYSKSTPNTRLVLCKIYDKKSNMRTTT